MTAAGGQKGMALLVVLVIVALLTTLTLELAFSTLVDLRLTETFRDRTRAYYLARGGITAGRMFLQEDGNAHDSRHERWAQEIINYPAAEGAVSIAIEDLNGRLAINELVRQNNAQTFVVDRFYRFFAALGIEHLADPAELTAALIDWLDEDDDPYQLIRTDNLNIPVVGAENPAYQHGQSPSSCKNGPLDSIEELLLVRGFTRKVVEIAAPHLTVNGDTRININTASDKVLMSLDSLISKEVAATLIERREQAPIKSISELADLLPNRTYSVLKSLANQHQLTTTSSYYRITSEGSIADGKQRLVAEVDKRDNTLLLIKVD